MNNTLSQHGDVLLIAYEDAGDAADVRSMLFDLGYTIIDRDDRKRGRALAKRPLTVIVFQSPISDKNTALTAISDPDYEPVLGVFACSSSDWPEDLVDACIEFVGWPCNRRELRYRLERVANRLAAESDRTYSVDVATEFAKLNLVGESTAFRNLLKKVEKAARYDVPILLEGETGTGKELIARTLHYMGARGNRPFIPVNCGALPDSLVENELFGHKKGAYTGAGTRQHGLVEQAHGGDLFLDEIGSLSSKAQVSLLRFLELHEYRPLGGDDCLSVDVRVIAASNTSLGDAVDNGTFRQDLFFRLNVLSLTLPPLADRDGDIDLLADYFITRLNFEFGQRKALSPLARTRMNGYSWPGNVRELENQLRREYFFNETSVINFDSLAEVPIWPSEQDTSAFELDSSFNAAKAKAIDDFEREYLSVLMRKVHGNVTRAAKLAGKERRAMGKLLKKHGIDKSAYY